MMVWVSKALQSSIMAKVLMAITGLMLVGFLVGHLVGNMLVFAGPEALNAYAEGLHKLGGLLWVARIGILTVFITHLYFAFRLTAQNKAATPEKYAVSVSQKASFASKSMFQTGLVILLFVLYHLAHYTFKITHSEYQELDPYSMVIAGFSSVPLALFYIVCMVAVMVHLSHGISSAFQSLGINHPKYNCFIHQMGKVVAIVLGLGFISIPLSIMLGIVR